MKSPSPDSPPAPTGPRYWRSLDELADTPAFREWVEREFPQGASEWRDPVSRRHFAKIMSASFLLAGFGLTGCRRPEEIIVPFSKMPENYVHGVPQYYATSMPVRRGAQALVAKSLDGRPLKVEGNPAHPIGVRGTDLFAQASILDLYDPDRATRYLKNGAAVIREVALDFLGATARQMAADGGQGAAFLLDQSSSPSRARLQALLSGRYPKARWFTHEGVDFDIHREAASQAYETPAPAGSGAVSGCAPLHHLDQAKVVVAFDCDFLGNEPDGARSIRDFARSRKIEKPTDVPSRLYVVEALLTITGANADHRQRLTAGKVWAAAAQLAIEVLSQTPAAEGRPLADGLKAAALPAVLKPEWVKACAADLIAHRGASLLLAGHRQSLAVHLLVHALNQVLGNVGTTVSLQAFAEPHTGSLEELAGALNRGEVQTLIICGGNPCYTAPADLQWTLTQRKARTVVRLGYYEDETAAQCDWHIPAAHYLESWGDARTADSTVVSIQPLIAPLFDGMTVLELLARLAGLERPDPYEITRETLAGLVKGPNPEAEWKKFLHDGFLQGSASPTVQAPFRWAGIGALVKEFIEAQAKASASPSKENLEVIFHADYSVDDGRYNNNGWLQELPDPITKVTWENVITLSVRTAREFGIPPQVAKEGKFFLPVVRLELGGRSVEGPVWVQPGQADFTVGLALGYGREKTGRVGAKAGFNAYAARASKQLHFASGAKLTVTGRTHQIATTQDHWSMEGRAIVREANLEQFQKNPGFAKQLDLDAHEPHDGPIYKYPKPNAPTSQGLHQWGMSIDLNACVGCSACMIACQSENNVPIVGKDQVARGREMHWIRLDRYYSVAAEDTDLGDPQVLNQPMLCQHCENAPCEYVCPVNATVHDEEGLNLMVYNRCVGTRYCSNNCPYKVRRFNFFDYNQRPLDKLYQGPLAPKGMPDLLQIAKNPEVTVRMRGVMEKCTFCIQRIEQAKIARKIKAGPSGDVRVPDGTITPACAQACPAEAIVFGDVSDPESRVSRLKKQERDYSVLGFLNTVPRTTYMARIRHPNPQMPDYHQQPLSRAEQAAKMGEPESGSHGAGHQPADPVAATGGRGGAAGGQQPAGSAEKGGH
jgi:MoCo/4Fe-4S cofactor protein with predicted Tat translocation signal